MLLYELLSIYMFTWLLLTRKLFKSHGYKLNTPFPNCISHASVNDAIMGGLALM